MIAKSNLKKVSLKSVGAVVASGALVAAMAVPAFAETITSTQEGSNSTSAEVKATFDDSAITGAEGGIVYSVDVTWASMDTFEYTVSDGGGTKTYVWEPATHTYAVTGGDNTMEGGWIGSGTVKVVNHSNADINAEATFAAESGLDDITGSFADGADNGNDSSETLATGVGRTPDGADSNQFKLTISGNEEALSTVAGSTAAKIGTATVTITQA